MRLPRFTFLMASSRSVSSWTSFTTSMVTFPLRSRIPKNRTFPVAPRPRFPFLLPPKYDSSISISTENEEAFASVVSIAFLMREWILYTVLYANPNCFDASLTEVSSSKNLIAMRNLVNGTLNLSMMLPRLTPHSRLQE